MSQVRERVKAECSHYWMWLKYNRYTVRVADISVSFSYYCGIEMPSVWLILLSTQRVTLYSIRELSIMFEILIQSDIVLTEFDKVFYIHHYLIIVECNHFENFNELYIQQKNTWNCKFLWRSLKLWEYQLDLGTDIGILIAYLNVLIDYYLITD